MNDMDNSNLKDSEIKSAMILAERRRLKALMHTMEKEDQENEKKRANESVVQSMLKRTWIKYAVAAGILGVIVLSTFLLTKTKPGDPGMVKETAPVISDTGKVQKEDSPAIANVKQDSLHLNLNVNTEESLGFASRPEQLETTLFWISDAKDLPGPAGGTYTYQNRRLTIYLNLRAELQIYKIDRLYYLTMADLIFRIDPADRPAPLVKIADRIIAEKIAKINFQLGVK